MSALSFSFGDQIGKKNRKMEKKKDHFLEKIFFKTTRSLSISLFAPPRATLSRPFRDPPLRPRQETHRPTS